MGRGRGPILCHNCQQQGHYAIDFPQPTRTCMYYCATDHVTEECPRLMMKIHEKRNLNNHTFQWIVVEIRDPGRNINIVTRGGAKIGAYARFKRTLSHNNSLMQRRRRKLSRKQRRSSRRKMKPPHRILHRGMILLFLIYLSLWIILTK
jgi:hypothetical protein